MDRSCARTSFALLFLISCLLVLGFGRYVEAASPPRTSVMMTNRYSHTAVLLLDGRVLVCGGCCRGTGDTQACHSSAELYDPVTGTWTQTGDMTTPRCNHTATRLANGRVLVTGGYNATNGYLATAEIYDPSLGTWRRTGTMSTARMSHTATWLADHKVLVAAGAVWPGDDFYTSLSSAELYDPATEHWQPTGSLKTPRSIHTALLLTNGLVLVLGGTTDGRTSLSSVELYDPALGTWTPSAAMSTGRLYHAAALLPNGKVLATGGRHPVKQIHAISTTEIFDPLRQTWTPIHSLTTARFYHAATSLPNGDVLVTGGYDAADKVVATTEIFCAATGTWKPGPPLTAPRASHQSTLLTSEMVLLSGGVYDGAGAVSDTAELVGVAADAHPTDRRGSRDYCP